MIIDDVEQLKEWLTLSLGPICEADPSALAKYVVALVKKDKARLDLKDSCMDQLDVFLQSKTKDFVENLFEVLDNKSYIKVTNETKPVNALPVDVPDIPPPNKLPEPAAVSLPSGEQLVSSTSKTDLRKEDDLKEIFPVGNKRRKSRSRSISPRPSRIREDDRRRRYDDRRPPMDRGYQRRRSTSPRGLRDPRPRSPLRRRSPYRPARRSRSPCPKGRGAWGRSRSRSVSLNRSPRRSRSPGGRPRSPEGRIRSRTPGGRIRSRSPGGRIRSRSPGGRIRSRSPVGRIRSRSPGGRIRSRSPVGRIRSRSPGGRIRSPGSRSRSPSGRVRSRSPGGRIRSRSGSPRREVRARSPLRRSISPRYRSHSPRKRSRSGSRSRSLSSRRSRSGSPVRKVRRHSPDSLFPMSGQENGLVDSTNPNPSDSASSISVVTHTTGRYGETSASSIRCRDYDEKGFCVQGELCIYDHGTDPVIVESVRYPPGPNIGPPLIGSSLPVPPINMSVPPPNFFNRMPGIRPIRPDFPQEPYNPEAPAITRQRMPSYWPGVMDVPPPFMKVPPPPLPDRGPVHSRLGNSRELVNLTVQREVEEELDEDLRSSSTRTVIAPRVEPITVNSVQPPPPGVIVGGPDLIQQPVSLPQIQMNYSHPRFQRFPGPRKSFDFNRVGGYSRRPDQTNCTLEVRKIPPDMNNIAKLNEHFSKFGNLINIQVKYEGDPEGALVTYLNNAEALSCYKCSEPVFNNRFIKVFWHKKNEDTASQDQSSVSTTTQSTSPEESSALFRARLGPAPQMVIPPPSKLQLNNLTKKMTPSTDIQSPTPTEQAVVYTTSMGSISKTVYNSTAAAAATAMKAKALAQAQVASTSPTAVKAADYVSRMEKVKQMEAMKKDAAQKKLEIQKHKQELLEKQIEEQKKLIETLEKNKDMKEANKKVIMETLKTLSNSIEKLKVELSGRTRHDSGGRVMGMKSPEEAKKEMLDIELELITKTSAGEDTMALKQQLAQLTQIASSMGLIGRGRGRGGIARGPASTVWLASGITPTTPPPGIGRGRGRGTSLFSKGNFATRTLDRRPKVVEVTGFDADMKDQIASHLNALKGVESVEFNVDIPSAVVSFKTRREAELGIIHGSKFKTKMLKMNWHIPKPNFSGSPTDTSTDASTEDIDEDALLAVEDEDEENEEERSWRP